MTKKRQPANTNKNSISVTSRRAAHAGDSAKKTNTSVSPNAEYYRDVITHLRWALGIMFAMFLAFVAYAMFKDSKGYEIATRDAKDAARQASEWESRAHETFTTIDVTVRQKLAEIESKGQETTAKLLKEMDQQQRLMDQQQRVIELWAEVNFRQGDEEAIYKLTEKVLEVDPNNLLAMRMLPGMALHVAYYAGNDPPRRKKWAHKAIGLCKEREAAERGCQAFNLAWAYAMLGDEDECRNWLKIGEETDKLSPRKGVDVFHEFKNRDWFKQIKWPGEDSSDNQNH